MTYIEKKNNVSIRHLLRALAGTKNLEQYHVVSDICWHLENVAQAFRIVCVCGVSPLKSAWTCLCLCTRRAICHNRTNKSCKQRKCIYLQRHHHYSSHRYTITRTSMCRTLSHIHIRALTIAKADIDERGGNKNRLRAVPRKKKSKLMTQIKSTS